MNIIKTKLNVRQLKESINKLDHIHTHERKIKFLSQKISQDVCP